MYLVDKNKLKINNRCDSMLQSMPSCHHAAKAAIMSKGSKVSKVSKVSNMSKGSKMHQVFKLFKVSKVSPNMCS